MNIKAGARHSANDNALIQTLHDSAVKLGATCPGGGEKSALSVTIRDGLAKLSAQHKSIKGLDYANVEAWDIQNGAQALGMLASIAASEAAQEEPEHVQVLAGIITALLGWLAAEVAEMNNAAAAPELVVYGKSAPEDRMVLLGSEVKALGDGRIGGYLVRFGNPETPDLSEHEDYFDAKTYFGARAGDGVDVTINHGIPLKRTKDPQEAAVFREIADHFLPPIKTKLDKIGLFAETVVNLADEYDSMVYELSKKGKMRWSSGAVGHLVKRTEMPNGTHHVDTWIIGEAALTPTPAEPRGTGVRPLKSFAAELAGWPESDGSTPLETDADAAKMREWAGLFENSHRLFDRWKD